MEYLEKELNITDQDIGVGESREGSYGNSDAQRGNNAEKGNGGKNSIEESIDEIEAALAQLKKELGL